MQNEFVKDPTKLRKTLYALVAIVLPWLWKRVASAAPVRASLNGMCASHTCLSLTQPATASTFWRTLAMVMMVIDKVIAVAQYINSFVFLLNGRFPSLVDRAFSMALVYSDPTWIMRSRSACTWLSSLIFTATRR